MHTNFSHQNSIIIIIWLKNISTRDSALFSGQDFFLGSISFPAQYFTSQLCCIILAQIYKEERKNSRHSFTAQIGKVQLREEIPHREGQRGWGFQREERGGGEERREGGGYFSIRWLLPPHAAWWLSTIVQCCLVATSLRLENVRAINNPWEEENCSSLFSLLCDLCC